MADIILRPHVLSQREAMHFEVQAGATVQDIVDIGWPDADVHDCVLITVNGDVIPREYWGRCKPKETSLVRGALILQGGRGGGGKNILQTIAMIAVVVVATFVAGPAVLGLTGLVSTLAVAGMTMVGGMLVSSLFKPPSIDAGGTSATTDPSESATYSVSGTQNQASPYGIVPRIYGLHKMFPRIVASPFSENAGASQFLYMLLDFGHGPVELDEFLIGETPLDSYRDVQYLIHPEFVAGDPLTLYTNDTASESVGVVLTTGQPEQRTTELKTIRISVDVVFPRGIVTFDDRGKRRASSGIFTINIRPVGLIPWLGFNAYPNTVSSDLAYRSDASTKGSGSFWVEGNELIKDFPGNERSSTYGIKVGRVELIFTGGEMPRPGTSILFPDGAAYVVQVTEGATITLQRATTRSYTVRRGDVPGDYSLRWLRLSWYGGGAADGRIVVTAATTEPVSLTVSITVPEGQYEVQVTKNHAKPGDTKTFNDVTWSGLRSMANRPPIAPVVPHTIMEVRIRASEQLSGAIQNLSAVAQALLPVWDGTGFVRQATRNPAWAWLDVLRGQANTRPMLDALIDIESVIDWAAYCDELVDDGASGLEPRCVFDHIVDYRSTIYQMLNSIAAAGRATINYRDGKLGVIIDREQLVPVQMFTPRNSWEFQASRTYLIEPHALRCNFIDPVLGYQEGTVMVYAPGYDADTATVFEDLKMFGVTRSTQCWRDGSYSMAQGMLRRETFSIEVDIENLACLRGDLVLVQHDVLRVGGDSSRIISVESETLFHQYDNLPTIPPGNYGVRIRRTDGVIVGPIQATPAYPNGWTLATPVPDLEPDDLVVWGILGIEVGEYVVKQITPGADLKASVALTEKAPLIYDADLGVIPPYVPPANGRPGTFPQPVSGITITQTDRTIGRRPVADLVATWSVPPQGNFRRFRVYEVRTDNSLLQIGETTGAFFVVVTNEDVVTSRFLDADVSYGVQAIDNVGVVSEVIFATEALRNPLWQPDPVLHLASNVQGATTTLTWRDPVANGNEGNAQVAGYDVRWSPDVNAAYDQASRVAEFVTWETHTMTVPTRNGVYLIKPFTTSGIYAAQPARTVTQTEDLARHDWYRNLRFDPAWTGQFIDTEIVGGALLLKRLPDGTFPAVGYWQAAYKEEFNQELVCRISTFLAVGGYNINNILGGPHWEPIANAVPIQSTQSSLSYDAKLWIAGSNRLTSVIADWVPMNSAIPLAGTEVDLSVDARPIINGEFQARAIYFLVELRSFDPQTSPAVSICGADIDFPEREDTFSDVAVPSGGLRIVYTYPFVYPPVMAFTLQNAQPGEFVFTSNNDQFGVNVQVRDSGGVGVDGLIDASFYGVGRLA